MKTRLSILSCGSVLASLYLAPGLVAQESGDFFERTSVEAMSDRSNPVYDPQPVRNGSFNFSPQVLFSTGQNQNVRADGLNELDDIYVGIAPSIDIDSDWARHAFGVSFGIENVQFSDLEDENRTDSNIGLRGRLDLGAQSNITLSFDAADVTEDRTELSNISTSIEPNEFTRVGAALGFNHQAGRFLLETLLSGASYDHDDTELEGDLFQDQDFRDHSDLTASARAAYALNRKVAIYADVDHTEADYDEPNIFNIFNRDHSGTVLLLGSDFALGESVSGDIGLGYQYYTYDDANFEDISDVAFAGHVDWRVADATTLTAEAGRTVIDPGNILTNAAIETGASVRLEQALTSKFFVNGEAGFTQYQFETIERDDDRLNFSVGANWKINRNLWLEGGYQLTDQSSDVQEFTDNRVLLKMRIFP